MRNFTALYFYEWKKICERKIVWLTMGITIAIIVLSIVQGVLMDSHMVTTGENSVSMSGFEYLKYRK